MKSIKTILLSALTLFAFTADAQYTFQGKIEFERKVNVHRQIDELDEDSKEWVERFKSQLPKFKVNYFDLYFNTEQSVYKPGKETEEKVNAWFASFPGAENVVHTDFRTKKVAAQKAAYEETFLVQDTMREIQWKIMDEIRTIANYKCRKAVGIMCDSVYVVAFYTDDIPATGGPEMFSGLPGMILEVAIPRLYTTWIATKVEIEPPKETDLKKPEKGKKTNQQDLAQTIRKATERWGKASERYVWWTLL